MYYRWRVTWGPKTMPADRPIAGHRLTSHAGRGGGLTAQYPGSAPPPQLPPYARITSVRLWSTSLVHSAVTQHYLTITALTLTLSLHISLHKSAECTRLLFRETLPLALSSHAQLDMIGVYDLRNAVRTYTCRPGPLGLRLQPTGEVHVKLSSSFSRSLVIFSSVLRLRMSILCSVHYSVSVFKKISNKHQITYLHLMLLS